MDKTDSDTLTNLKAENKKLAKRVELLENKKTLNVQSIIVSHPDSPYKVTIAVDPNIGGVWLMSEGSKLGSISFFNDGNPALQLVDTSKNIKTFGVND